MNRYIWIARISAVVILVVVTILMVNLYLKLSRMSPVNPPAPASQTST